MKAQIRLATKEYCYIEFTVAGTAEDIIAEYHRIQQLYKNGTMNEQEFNKALDLYLKEGTMDSNVYEALTQEQKNIVQCLKRSLKRINSRN